MRNRPSAISGETIFWLVILMFLGVLLFRNVPPVFCAITLGLVLAIVGIIVWLHDRAEVKRAEALKAEEQIRKEVEERARIEAERARQKQVDFINEQRPKWGDRICTLLLARRYGELIDSRILAILDHYPQWSEITCIDLISREVQLDMTSEMVRLAWGEPSEIEDKELTRSKTKIRWRYGQPRRGATYVWFTNGIVTKIQK